MGIATTFVAGRRPTAAQLNLKPYLHATQSATQTLTTATWAAITMGAETLDTINGHSTVSNTSRYTPTQAGWYRCLGMVAFTANTTGDRAGQFRKNGLQVPTEAAAGAMPSMKGAVNFSGNAWAAGTISCNGTTDYIELWGIQDSGGNLDTSVAQQRSFMIIEWVAPL